MSNESTPEAQIEAPPVITKEHFPVPPIREIGNRKASIIAAHGHKRWMLAGIAVGAGLMLLSGACVVLVMLAAASPNEEEKLRIARYRLDTIPAGLNENLLDDIATIRKSQVTSAENNKGAGDPARVLWRDIQSYDRSAPREVSQR